MPKYDPDRDRYKERQDREAQRRSREDLRALEGSKGEIRTCGECGHRGMQFQGSSGYFVCSKCGAS